MRLISFCLVVIMFLPCLVAVCNAALVGVTFEGNLDYIHSSLATRFSLGDPMQVSIIYETPWPDSNPDSDIGLYLDSIQSLTVSIDSADPYTASATSGQWEVFNDYDIGPPFDAVFAKAYAPISSEPGATLTGSDVAGLPLWEFLLQLKDSTTTALSSDALPMSFTVGDFDDNQLSLAWREGGYNRWIKATKFTSTSYIIPVPGALLLSGIGIGCVSWLRRRRTI